MDVILSLIPSPALSSPIAYYVNHFFAPIWFSYNWCMRNGKLYVEQEKAMEQNIIKCIAFIGENDIELDISYSKIKHPTNLTRSASTYRWLPTEIIIMQKFSQYRYALMVHIVATL